MRFLAIALVLLLPACAAAPDQTQFFYRGVYVPGEAAIGSDGSFVSRATVWNKEQSLLAGEAALFRLEMAARQAGYTHFVMEEASRNEAFGHQYVVTGKLYAESDAPEMAVPIGWLGDLDGGPAEPALQFAPAADPVPAAARRPVAAPVPAAETPTPAAEPEGEPLVIEAPDFITATQSAQPYG